MRERLKLFVVVGCIFLASCSSSPSHDRSMTDLTAEQVRTSKDFDQLQRLQRSFEIHLADKDPEKSAAEFAFLQELNRRIVDLQIQHLKKILNTKRIGAEGDYHGKIPLPELEKLKNDLRQNNQISASLLPEILSPINQEQTDTENLIEKLKAEVSGSKLAAERRATVYHQLFIITGDLVWQDARDKQMDVIIEAIHQALEKSIASKSLEEKIDFVRTIYTEQPAQIVDDMHSAYAQMFNGRYLRAQAKGNFDAAFKVLQDLAQKPDYEKIKDKLKPNAPGIAAAYVAYVADGIDLGWNLSQSFHRYNQEIEVRRILGLEPEPHPKTAQLLQQISKKYDSVNQQNPFAGLGLLYAQEIIAPDYEDRTSALAHQQALIQNSTLRSVKVLKFRSRYDDLNYGDVITPLITQYLYDALEGRIQIIEQSGDFADAVITGNILEAKIDHSQTRNKKQLRVTVGEHERPNPAYIAWLELPARERAKQEKPSETIREEKQESIYITNTLHRKVGIFAVSYRLVDGKNDRVIFPDSITLQAEHEDESSEGLEVGELIIPYKVAKLPMDSEIMHKLAENTAKAVAANLVAVLQNQENEYLKMADKSAAQNNCVLEIENLAKALSLMQAKTNSADARATTTRDRLVERTLACI